jgi:DNA-binding transcriptional ArsR family regulator
VLDELAAHDRDVLHEYEHIERNLLEAVETVVRRAIRLAHAEEDENEDEARADEILSVARSLGDVVIDFVDACRSDLAEAGGHGGVAAAAELARRIARANRELALEPDQDLADANIPTWLLNEETKRLTPIVEFRWQRPLTAAEVATFVRGEAAARLVEKQEKLARRALWALSHGEVAESASLAEFESEKRSERRRRAREREREESGLAPAAPLRARILAALSEKPDLGLKQVARAVRARPGSVQRELESMRVAGIVARMVEGQKHRYAVAKTSTEPVPELSPQIVAKGLRDAAPAVSSFRAPFLTHTEAHGVTHGARPSDA